MEFILMSFLTFFSFLSLVFAFSLFYLPCFSLRSPQSSNPTTATNVNEALKLLPA